MVHVGVASYLPGRTELKQREISASIATSWTVSQPDIPTMGSRNAMHSATTIGQKTNTQFYHHGRVKPLYSMEIIANKSHKEKCWEELMAYFP